MKITHLLFATDFCAPGRGRVFVPSLVLAVLLAGIPAVSAADTASECSKATGETSIAACSLLIESNRLSTADLAVTYNYRGVAYARSGEFDRAIADFGEAIRRYPKSALFYPYINRGDAYKAKNDVDRAIADYSEAIRLDPKSALAYNKRAHVWERKREYDRAITDYTEAIRIDPDGDGTTYYFRGVLYGLKRDLEPAIADFTAAIRLEPGLAAAYPSRGIVVCWACSVAWR